MREVKRIVATGLVVTILGQITGEFFVNASELVAQSEQSVQQMIKAEDITVSQKELTPGEDVVIRFNSNGYYYGETVTAEYQTPKGEEYFQLRYNWENECYEYTYTIPTYAKDGTYQIYRLYSSYIDIVNSQVSESGEVDLSGGDFTVTGGIVDEEAPIIDVQSLNVTPKVANPGDTILMQVKASDNTAVDYVNLYYTYSDLTESYSSSVTLSFNEESRYFEYLMKITNNGSKNGKYHLNYIEAYDVLGNHTRINDVDYEHSAGNTEDLSSGDYVIEGVVADHEAPVIDFESFKIDKKVVKPGDIVTVEAKVSDVSNIAYFNVSYRSEIYQASYPYLEFKLDEKTGMYKASFEVDENYADGVYEVSYIEISDEHWNSETYYGDDVNLDYVSFTVEGARPEFNAPEIDLDSIVVDKDIVEVGKKIKFSLYAHDDTAIESVFMDYFNHEVGGYIALELSYNQETDRYELEYKIPHEMSEGLWELGTVYAKDIYGESVFYYDHSAQQNWVDIHDLSSGDFTVIPFTGEEDDEVEVPNTPVAPSYEDDRIQIKFEDNELKLNSENGNYILSNVKQNVTKIKFTINQTSVARFIDEEMIVVTLKLSNNATNFAVNGVEAVNGEIILELETKENVYPISLLDESGEVIETYSFTVEKAGLVTPPSEEGGNSEAVTPPSDDNENNELVTPPSEDNENDESVTPPSEDDENDESVTPPSEDDENDESVTPPSDDEQKQEDATKKPETGIVSLGVVGTGAMLIGVGVAMNVRRRSTK